MLSRLLVDTLRRWEHFVAPGIASSGSATWPGARALRRRVEVRRDCGRLR